MRSERALMTTLLTAGGLWSSAMAATPLPTVTIGQLRADPDKYSNSEFIVKGYVDIRAPYSIIDTTRMLIRDKAADRRFDATMFATTKKGQSENDRILATECIDIWDISPLRRDGKLINRRDVVLRAKLIDVGKVLNICSGSIELSIEEVLDPAPLKQRLSKPDP